MVKNVHRVIAIVSLCCVCLGLDPHAAIAVPVLDFTGGSTTMATGPLGLGWAFTVTSPLEVVALGIFDEGADGLINPHDVFILPSGGSFLPVPQALAQALITNSNSVPVSSTSPDGQWLATAITPVVLAPGDYDIAAFYFGSTLAQGEDPVRIGAMAATIAGVTFGGARNNLGGLVLVSDPLNNDGIFGPNMFTANAIVPEPPSLILLGAALAGLAIARMRGTPKNDVG